MADGKLMLVGKLGDEYRFAFVDEAARYCAGQVCKFKFSATLAPYKSEDAARAALEAEGAADVGEAPHG